MWHEARRSERKVHDLMDAARRRAQRRAVFLAKRRGDPQQSLQIVGSRCRMYRDDGLYQATQDQQGLIPWNGKQNILIDRFDGRALLDFIRDCDSRMFRAQEKTEEEEELEEFVNFERYRDLIKHRRRGCRLISVCSTVTDEEGLQHANQELEEKAAGSFASERSYASQPSASKASYSQVGFSYEGDGKEESQLLECDDDDDDEDDDVDDDEEDSDDEGMEAIAKEFGVKRFNWLVYMDRKAKEEERRQKEVVKGDPAMKKLSRKERRKASQIERERERETACITGTRMHHYDPYREPRRSPTYEAYSRHRISRSKSRSCSPSHVRRYDRGSHADNGHRNKLKAPKIEYITEFGSSDNLGGQKIEAFSPPPSPSQANLLNRPSTGRILEALHVDPASAVSLDQEKNMKLSKPSLSTASALAKLSNPTATVGPLKPQQSEKKETPQERLKRIMSKQLNKQIKKDTVAEMARKRELERQRQEKLAETRRLSQYRRRSQSRSYSPSPRYRRSRSRSRSRSPRRYYSRSRSPRVRSHSRHH